MNFTLQMSAYDLILSDTLKILILEYENQTLYGYSLFYTSRSPSDV